MAAGVSHWPQLLAFSHLTVIGAPGLLNACWVSGPET